jgi:hypothetical protein
MHDPPSACRRRLRTQLWSEAGSAKPEFAAAQFNFSRLPNWANYGRAGPRAKGFPMKAIVAICVAIATLWLADIELNDGRYSEATGRTIVGLIKK